MLAHSLTVIVTNDSSTHKRKINVLSFKPLIEKREKKRTGKNGLYWLLCKD